MSRHKTGIDRCQISIEPLSFDELIEESPARAIDAIVNRFDMAELGFTYCEASIL